MQMSFAVSLNEGRVGESLIATWLKRRGWYILPVYEIEIDSGKGPRIFAPNGEQVIAPDVLALHPDKGEIRFIECKHKSVFSWHRRSSSWQTGIDLKHWHDYLKLRVALDHEIWLLFLHKSEEPWHGDRKYGCPDVCPTGLYGQELMKLTASGREDTRHARGMIYWKEKDLRKLAPVDELILVDDAICLDSERFILRA